MHDTTTPHPPAQGKPTYDPAEWTPVIEQAFLDHLLHLLGTAATRRWPEPVDAPIVRRLTTLLPDLDHLVATHGPASEVTASQDMLTASRTLAGRHHVTLNPA